MFTALPGPGSASCGKAMLIRILVGIQSASPGGEMPFVNTGI